MELKQLAALVTVADTGSVTKASAVLHLVQPAVTRQIRSLEQELGVQLFERTRSGMVPTPAGEIMVDRARRALSEVELARAEIRPDPTGISGIVRIGIMPSVVAVLSQPFVSAVAREHPRVDLRILSGFSGHLETWLASSDLDLSLLYLGVGAQAFALRPLVEEKLFVVAAAREGLSNSVPVTLSELAGHALVVPPIGHALRTLIESACAEAGLQVQPAVETNSMQVQKELALTGYGWTILPGIAVAREVRAGLLSAAPLGDPPVTRTIGLALPRQRRIPSAVVAVAQLLTATIEQLVKTDAWPSESRL